MIVINSKNIYLIEAQSKPTNCYFAKYLFQPHCVGIIFSLFSLAMLLININIWPAVLLLQLCYIMKTFKATKLIKMFLKRNHLVFLTIQSSSGWCITFSLWTFSYFYKAKFFNNFIIILLFFLILQVILWRDLSLIVVLKGMQENCKKLRYWSWQ